MKSSARLVLIAVVVILIAIALWFWFKGDEKPATPVAAVTPQPEAVTPPPKPAPPIIAPVLFTYNRSDVSPEEAKILDGSIADIKAVPYERLDVIGHTDRIGSDSYNEELSKDRAGAVRDYMGNKGLDAGRIRVNAKGESESVTGESCSNLAPEKRTNLKLIECLARDRRVEIKFIAAQ